MKEAILDFRKTCKVLQEEKGYKAARICSEINISTVTLSKILNDDLTEMKGVRASTIGAIQNFNKKHIDDVRYAGLGDVEILTEKVKKDIPSPKPKEYFAIGLKEKPEKPGKIENELVELGNAQGLAEFLTELSKNIPTNVIIKISINEK